MQSKLRIFLKSVTWQALGLVTMTLIGHAFTGSYSAGGKIAVIGAATGFVTYYLHELLWARVGWGKVTPREAPARRDGFASRRAG
ncbi:MAG: DUF2061 domain-containing protein [Alphaproteobacteria bacterium]|nr:MAG: DUF2061 domain-containing protein [Alphaproteobacteria bacterium]